jgi:hypothetical protein
VRLDAFFEPVEDRPQVQVVGLDGAEVPNSAIRAGFAAGAWCRAASFASIASCRAASQSIAA